MGIYLNPDNENFKAILTREIYVDKTMMLSVLNNYMATDNKYICVSRPRRFGKTFANNMIAAYYSKGCDSRELFSKLKFYNDESFEANLNKFNVIKLDINSEYRNATDKEYLIADITEIVRSEFIQQFPDIVFSERDSIGRCILKVYAATSEKFVILLDEYDVLIRENVSDSLFAQYLDLLNGLFKSDTVRPAIALAYLTGILPIVRDKVQSKLNNFEEYTILSASVLTEFVGFTDDEVYTLCKTYNIDFEECKKWYDGYHLSFIDAGKKKYYEVYNPESVVKTMKNMSFGNYWSKTSTYEVISDRLKANFQGLKDDIVKMISGEKVDVDVGMYKNTMKDFVSKNDIYTYLMHLGYLAYDEEEKQCSIPNKEVHDEWFRAISIDDDYAVTNKIIQASKELLSETLNGNAELVAASLDESHIHVTSNRSYNNEYALQSAIYLSFIYALNKYTVIREMTTGKGFADVVYIPYKDDIPALIIELKRNGSTESALNQIKEKKYFASLEHYKGNLLFVGINYDEKTKKHECNIEQLAK